MRRPHESTEKLIGCFLLRFFIEPCFHTHSLKSHLGPMQKGFLIQGLVLLICHTALTGQVSARSHQRKRFLIFYLYRRFLFLLGLFGLLQFAPANAAVFP